MSDLIHSIGNENEKIFYLHLKSLPIDAEERAHKDLDRFSIFEKLENKYKNYFNEDNFNKYNQEFTSIFSKIVTKDIIEKITKKNETLFILPGAGEPIEKYLPYAEFFVNFGVDVVVIDWPGQGLSSDCFDLSNFQNCHIDDFNNYYLALLEIIKKVNPKKVNFLAHSLGGLILINSVKYISLKYKKEDKKLGHVFLSNPALKLKKEFFGMRLLLKLLMIFGFKNKRIIEDKKTKIFDGNLLTDDLQSFEFFENLKYKKNNVTYGWVNKFLQECNRNKDLNFRNWDSINLFVADNDKIIDTIYTREKLYSSIAFINIFDYKSSFHELLFCKKETKKDILEKIISKLAK